MLLSSLTLRNLLSVRDATLELRPLNVLIGPNVSGKSNLVEAIGLLQAAPVDLRQQIDRGGGIREWIWKGEDSGAVSPVAGLECGVQLPQFSESLVYKLRFTEEGQALKILEERLEQAPRRGSARRPLVHLDRRPGQLSLGRTRLEAARILPVESMLARLKSPGDTTPVTSLGRELEGIRIYREFNTGPLAKTRTGVSTASRKDALAEDGSNLAVMLNEMEFNGAKERVTHYLSRLNEGFRDVLVRLEGGIARVYVREERLSEPTPANRLSDGTLKFLCLLTVLLDPKPPSLICLEEPELGLHPEAVQVVAELLTEAAVRAQLIVTTHSESLVDALSSQPEVVVVCERDFDYGTRFRRLREKELDAWLERYSLGELWRKGEIGGNRW
jgi:predicted ATPase